MLPKKYRLPSFLIPKVLKKGKRFYSFLFVLVATAPFLEEKKEENPQFAFIVSKKLIKKSTVRNKIKRRFSAIIYKLLKEIRKPLWSCFLIKKQAATEDFSLLEKEVKKTLKKADSL